MHRTNSPSQAVCHPACLHVPKTYTETVGAVGEPGQLVARLGRLNLKGLVFPTRPARLMKKDISASYLTGG